MRILVTGASGFIGRNLLGALRGHEVLTLSRGENPNLIRRFRPEKIFHLAGETLDEPRMFESNVCLTHDLLDAANTVDYSVFCYLGSSSEYGRCTAPMNEQQAIRPTNTYEATKGCGTLLCMAAAAMGRPVCVVRPFSVYGRFQPARQFIPSLYRSFRAGATFPLAPGSHDWIHADDFIRGLLKVTDAAPEVLRGAIVNLGTGVQTSNEAVVETFQAVVGQVAIRRIPRIKNYDSDCWVADTSLAQASFGFRAEISLAEGLAAYAAEQA